MMQTSNPFKMTAVMLVSFLMMSTPLGSSGEDGFALTVAFGGQPLEGFSCSSRTAPFGTLQFPRRDYTVQECLDLCLDEDVTAYPDFYELGCCSFDAGSCTLLVALHATALLWYDLRSIHGHNNFWGHLLADMGMPTRTTNTSLTLAKPYTIHLSPTAHHHPRCSSVSATTLITAHPKNHH